MMKRNALVILITLAISSGFFASCEQDNTQTLIDQEKSQREKYVSSLSPAVQPTSSGLYYIQGRTGIGASPKDKDTVYIYYKTSVLYGSVFDQNLRPNKPFGFIVGSGDVISGLNEGVKLMREGDTATLLLPSSLGYGSVRNGEVPAYSNLLFEVELYKVNN